MSDIPPSADTLLTTAWRRFDEGNTVEAIQLAREALKQTPEGHPNYYAALGWFLLAAGSSDDAEAILVSSIGLYPEYAPLHWYLGLVHLHEHRLEEASQALLAAVTFDPKLDEAAVSLAWVLGDLGRVFEATHYCRQAMTIKTNPDRFAQLGWLLLSLGEWTDAVLQLTNALSLEPARVDTRCHLAIALHKLGSSEEALKLLSDGLGLSSEAPALLQQHIRLLIELHRTDEARASVDRLLALAPEDAASHTLASIVFEGSGALHAASDHAEKAVACDEKSADAWRALAQVRTVQRRLSEATQALRTVLVLDRIQ